MTEKLKGLNIPDTIVPYTDQDVYATHDSKFGKGGWRSVDTMQEMFDISLARRSIGMIVYVIATKKTFMLNGSLNNDGWVLYSDQIDKHFSYTEHSIYPSDHWVIHHGLNKIPAIQIFDSNGKKIKGGITVIDENNITVDFNYPMLGTAELN